MCFHLTVNAELVRDFGQTAVVCSDLKKAYLLACEAEWVMISGRGRWWIDTVSPPTQNADGLWEN